MKLALNYSRMAAEMVRSGQIDIDRWKCPPWPEMIAEASVTRPVCVHFSLDVGAGIGDAIDGGTKQPADWSEIERIMQATDTQFVNLHLSPKQRNYPAFGDPLDPELVELVRANLLFDVQAVAARLGPEHIILENDNANGPSKLLAAVLPATITEIVENTGCGFLFDISHARLAAYHLGLDAVDYIDQLPLAATGELHVTGIQTIDESWAERLRQYGLTDEQIRRYAGRWQDHTPLTQADWDFLAWSKTQLRAGRWGEPQLCAVEIGGEGPFWQATFDPLAMSEQIPRLASLLRS
ncbi:MAG: DUF692 family protein [Caldilineales bacterium]|nr:DUF692 family protein [Caldilineales bacterium]